MRLFYIIGLIVFISMPASVIARKPEAITMVKGKGLNCYMPDISLKDTSGKLIKLNSLSGKLIYYDFWAAWCPLCIKELKYLQDLQLKLKDKDIQWVNISFDKDVLLWKKAIKENNMTGIQLYAGPEGIKTFKDELSIYGIPFIIWSDSAGVIVKYNAPRPSKVDVSEKLLSELNKIANKSVITNVKNKNN